MEVHPSRYGHPGDQARFHLTQTTRPIAMVQDAPASRLTEPPERPGQTALKGASKMSRRRANNEIGTPFEPHLQAKSIYVPGKPHFAVHGPLKRSLPRHASAPDVKSSFTMISLQLPFPCAQLSVVQLHFHYHGTVDAVCSTYLLAAVCWCSQ